MNAKGILLWVGLGTGVLALLMIVIALAFPSPTPKPVQKPTTLVTEEKLQSPHTLSLEVEEEPKHTESSGPEFITESQKLIAEAEQLIVQTQKFIEEKGEERQRAIEEAHNRSSKIKGVYMTELVALSRGSLRKEIKRLIEINALNAIVIDVKEVGGPNLSGALRVLVDEFHEHTSTSSPTWVIARVVAFRDCSLTEENPDVYLKTKEGEFWKDDGGGCWLDPASPAVWDYLIEFSKRIVDSGFDELQFDYVRFPSDGNLEDIVYPVYKETIPKYEIIRDFFLTLSQELKSYQPTIILSVDIFGYVAGQANAFSIGQRLEDVANTFDYISFMLYPSHFYGGFTVGKDIQRDLPALTLPYESEDINEVVSNRPYEVVSRSIFTALDYLEAIDGKAKIRPWLQYFNLKFDMERGIFYNAEEVQAQIAAAEESGASGWLIWNSENIYPEEIFLTVKNSTSTASP